MDPPEAEERGEREKEREGESVDFRPMSFSMKKNCGNTRKILLFSIVSFSLSHSLSEMADAPGLGAEREAAADIACEDAPPQASGKGGPQEEEVRGSLLRLAFFNASSSLTSLPFSFSPSLSPAHRARSMEPRISWLSRGLENGE